MVKLLGSSRAVFLMLLAVYAVVGVWTTRRVSATGDEPYYFMAADALLHGEGLDLTRRWERIAGASYDPAVPIAPDELQRNTAPSRVRAGSYPLHDVAPSLVIALPYAVGGRPLVVLVIAAAMAAAVALGHRAARALGSPARTALAGALAMGLSAPALTYSGQLFADALAPLAFAAGLCALVGALPSGLIGASAAALVLLHLRFWPLALAVLTAAIFRERPARRRVVALLWPLVAAVLGLSLLDLVTYGVPLPHAGFLLFFTSHRAGDVASFTHGIGEGIAGLALDRSFGLASAAPLSLLLVAGAGRLVGGGRDRVLLALPVPYLLLASAVDWTGGFSPQARYLTVLVPLFVVLMARAFEWPAARTLAAPLGIWTLGQSAVYAVAPWLRYDRYATPPLADSAWTRFVGPTPSAVFPLFGTDGAAALVLAWGAGLALLFIAAARGPLGVPAASRDVERVGGG